MNELALFAGAGGGILGGHSLDGAPFALLRLMPGQEASYSPVSGTGSLRPSRSGMTSERSTETHGAELWTLYPEDSPVKTSVPPGRELALKGLNLACGKKCVESFAKLDPDSCLWKTAQHSLFGGFTEFSQTWPRWGSMRNGECWERTIPEDFINGKESGFWPTPLKSPRDASCTMETALRNDGKSLMDSLSFMVARKEKSAGRHIPTGQLNPEFVEWLMGWPIGWSDCKPLEMGRFQEWRQQHSRSY